MKVELDGQTYQIDSWRGKDVTDFAPRASVPGGSIIHSELGLYQPIVKNDWQHGMGWQWGMDNEKGYLTTEGNIDTRHDGLVMMFTAPTQDDVDTSNAVEGFVNFNGDLYAWGDGGLYRQSGGSWSNVYSANAVNWAIATGTYLFYAPDGARIRKVNTSNTHSNAGVDSNATDFAWFAIHSGYIYAGKDASNVVHFDSTEDLSDLHGDTSGDTAEIYVGMNGLDTLLSQSWAGKLNIAKPDGIYQLSDDNQTARRILDFPQATDNFRFLIEWNSRLVFPVKNRIYTWNGSNTNDITPRRINESFPYTTYGRFDNATAVDRWLVVTARTNESTYEEHILAWDGIGWHKLAEPITDGSGSISAMGWDTDNNRLWYHLDLATDETYYIDFQANSEFPDANFPTSGTHSLISSRLAAGFRWVDKSAHALILGTANLDSGTYIDVYFKRNDDSSWILWESVKRNGEVRLEDPGGDYSLEFEHLQLKFEFITDDSSNSPVLEDWTLKVLLRPDESYGYTFDIPVRSQAVHGFDEDVRTAAEMIEDLKAARASKEPIELISPSGETMMGYITSVNEDAIEEHPDPEGGEPDIESNMRISFIQLPELTS